MTAHDHLLDPLTGALLREAFAGELAAVADHPVEASLSLLVIDLDHFKSINDAFGHLRGDQVLAEFGARARALVRESDRLVRYGGDEFVLLLPRTGPAQALLLAQRLIELIGATPFPGEPPLTITLSIGCASYPTDVSQASQLFALADQRLLTAKRAGRSRALAQDEQHEDQASFGRLIERESALAAGQRFLTDLAVARAGQLTIAGEPGSGRSALMAALVQAARLRGFAVIEVSGSAGLRSRHRGALTEARCSWPKDASGLSLASIPPAQRQMGLVIFADRLGDADPASVAELGNLLHARGDMVVGLVVTAPAPLRLGDAGLHAEIQLAPLSVRGMQLWLRGQLRWEPPPALMTWLADHSQGLPRRIAAAVALLKARQLLRKTAAGWELAPEFATLELPAIDQTPTDLPPLTDELIGRDAEMQRARAALAGGRLLTIVGPGGVGKTRLALQVAAELRDQYPDGVTFLPLAAVTDGEGMVQRMLALLSVPPLAGVAALRQLAHTLGGRAVLLVLDNLEQIAGVGEVVAELLAAAPQLRLIGTARARLDLPLEYVCELRGLDGAASTAALTLFRRQAVAAGAADPGEAPAVHAICAMVGGMPLGIKLAAAWAAIYALDEIAARIAAHASSAAEVSVLAGVFGYFWEQLSAEEVCAVAGLAIFQGGFRREDARAVSGISPLLLAALVDRAFLERGGGGRYALHPLLQQEAAARLWTDAANAALVARRHAYVFAGLAVRAGVALVGPEQVVWLARLAREQDNLRGALGWLMTHDPIAAVRVASDLAPFWRIRGHWNEGLDWLLRTIERLQSATDLALQPSVQPELKRAIGWAGTLAFEQAAYDQARDLLGERLALARVDADQAAIAATLATLGHIALIQGEFGLARLQLTEAIRLAREGSDLAVLLRGLNILGETDHREGRAAHALERYTEAHGLAQQLGDRRELADSLLGLGIIAVYHGDLEQAAAHYQACLALALAIGDRQREGESTGNLGEIAARRGDHVRAIELFTAAQAAFTQIDDQFSAALTLCFLGESAHALGDQLRAEAYVRQSLVLALRIGALPVVLMALGELAAMIQAERPTDALAVLRLVVSHAATHAVNRERARQRSLALAARLDLPPDEPTLSVSEALALLDASAVDSLG